MSLLNHFTRLLYRLFERHFSIGGSNCAVNDNGRMTWDHDDPQCYLKPHTLFRRSVPAGFYMLEVAVDEASRLDSRLYANYGDGFNDEQAFSLNVSTGKAAKRIIYLPREATKLRWDPAESEGWLVSPQIKLVPLTKARAIKRMREKLLRNSQKLGVNEQDVALLSDAEVAQTYTQWFAYQGAGFRLYEQWIEQCEPTVWVAKQLIEAIQFSIIVPVYNSKPSWLDELFDSVLQQTYRNWQLIFIDDTSTQQETKTKLQALAASDRRASIIWRDQNGHIAKATNDGLQHAKGSYVLFVDHDDFLSPHALNELAYAIKNNPSAKLVYSDEDLVSAKGQRLHPHFKSGWNPDLLLSHNYITHITCYEHAFLKSLGGFSKGVDGAQDYDLVLKAMAKLDAREVVHIPKVLYHWRMVDGSTASSATAKNYATQAGLTALQKHIERTASMAHVADAEMANFYDVTWPLPDTLPKISIIIPTKDGLEVLKPCVDSICATANYANLEIVIVDNGSIKSETASYLASLTPEIKQTDINEPISVRVVEDAGNFNFSRLMNLGATTASGEVLLLLNNDVEAIESGWLQAMLRHACREEIGCVGAKLLYPDLTIQHAGVILGLGGFAAHSHRGLPRHHPGYFGRAQVVQNLSAVTAACLMVRKSVFDVVGGFDELFEVAYNDVDFCIRVSQQGFRNLYEPKAELIHHESKTRGEDVCSTKRARFDGEKKRLAELWPALLNNDPYYNPNLTRSREDFSL